MLVVASKPKTNLHYLAVAAALWNTPNDRVRLLLEIRPIVFEVGISSFDPYRPDSHSEGRSSTKKRKIQEEQRETQRGLIGAVESLVQNFALLQQMRTGLSETRRELRKELRHGRDKQEVVCLRQERDAQISAIHHMKIHMNLDHSYTGVEDIPDDDSDLNSLLLS